MGRLPEEVGETAFSARMRSFTVSFVAVTLSTDFKGREDVRDGFLLMLNDPPPAAVKAMGEDGGSKHDWEENIRDGSPLGLGIT